MLSLAADAGGRSEGRRDPIRRVVSRNSDAGEAVAELRDQLADGDPAFIFLFVAPAFDLEALAAAASEAFGETPVFGATSAGEISPSGYEAGSIVAAAFERSHFDVEVDCIDDLSCYTLDQGRDLAKRLLRRLDQRSGSRQGRDFALLSADGLARREEALVAGLAWGFGSIPLLGGSAGDGLEFRRTRVLCAGRFRENAALVALVRSRCPFRLFKFDHFEPIGARMVVTGADVDERLITEINAEPAAEEYARLLHLDPSELSPFVFAAHPLVVRVGGAYYVRSIQGVEPGGGLRTFCAIDEGLVLMIARARHMARELEESLAELRNGLGEPTAVLTFDCVLRRLEAERTGQTSALSEILSRYRAVGFCSYGQQFRAMHVSQTVVGAYFYDPDAAAAAAGDLAAAE